MATAIELLRAAGGENSMFSRIGRWRLYVSKQLDTLIGGGGGCCNLLGVQIQNGVISQFVPFPAGCIQPDNNYIVTGVMTGGILQNFAIAAKAGIGFQVAFSGATAGNIAMDFKVDRC